MGRTAHLCKQIDPSDLTFDVLLEKWKRRASPPRPSNSGDRRLLPRAGRTGGIAQRVPEAARESAARPAREPRPDRRDRGGPRDGPPALREERASRSPARVE